MCDNTYVKGVRVLPGSQTENGKAFEYACLSAIHAALHLNETVIIEDSPQLRTASNYFNNMSETAQNELIRAANAAVRVIVRLEPQMQYPETNVPLYISIQTDAQGIAGDVRDVLCVRRQNHWQIGLSCKHNHHAVKHSRLSDTIDFGLEWFGIPCSEQYFSEVVPLFSELRRIRDNARNNDSPELWSTIPDKADRFYVPILTSFLDELNRLTQTHPEVPSLLVCYLLGRFDFYKVTTDTQHETTRVEAINIAGTLNRPSGNHRSIVDVSRLHLPTRFYHTGFKQNSNNTIEVVCDVGWTISMRIHNASSRVEPSLKFDVTLISLPNSIHAQVEPW